MTAYLRYRIDIALYATIGVVRVTDIVTHALIDEHSVFWELGGVIPDKQIIARGLRFVRESLIAIDLDVRRYSTVRVMGVAPFISCATWKNEYEFSQLQVITDELVESKSSEGIAVARSDVSSGKGILSSIDCLQLFAGEYPTSIGESVRRLSLLGVGSYVSREAQIGFEGLSTELGIVDISESISYISFFSSLVLYGYDAGVGSGVPVVYVCVDGDGLTVVMLDERQVVVQITRVLGDLLSKTFRENSVYSLVREIVACYVYPHQVLVITMVYLHENSHEFDGYLSLICSGIEAVRTDMVIQMEVLFGERFPERSLMTIFDAGYSE